MYKVSTKLSAFICYFFVSFDFHVAHCDDDEKLEMTV